jgi:hypothetical protein
MTSDEANKRHLSWGILFHMLGRSAKSASVLDRMTSSAGSPYGELSGALLTYIELDAPSCGRAKRRIRAKGKRRPQPMDRTEQLVRIVEFIGKLLDPRDASLPKLGYECDAVRGKRYQSGKAQDNGETGFSRDPFKKIEEE